jgi:uroporphyrinogen decarboxylase
MRSPDLAAELTMQPVRRYGVDAAILFSDIVVPLAAIGFGVDVHPGIGPVIEKPFRAAADLDRLRPFDPLSDAPYVLETVKILRRELQVPLIGFAGAPFTLASYLIEGGPSRDFVKTKTLMYGDPSLWYALVDRLADITLSSLQAQVAAGAQAVQLFDSWVGALSPSDYQRFVFDASSKVLRSLSDLAVPTIHFGVGTGELLSAMAATGASVVGVDWRVPLDIARQRVGSDITLQGNLDPAVLLAGWDATKERALDVLERGGGRRHVFNLGHGVLPGTDPDVLCRVVELCHVPRGQG